MMKKIFLFLIVAGAIGVIGSGVLDNYITLDTQDISQLQGAVSLECQCDDPTNPGNSEPCNFSGGTPMCEFP